MLSINNFMAGVYAWLTKCYSLGEGGICLIAI